MRAVAVDALAVVLLSIYGREACSYLDGLVPWEVLLRLGAAMALGHGLGLLAERRWVRDAPPLRRAGRTYWITFARYVLVAAATLALGHPIGSGLRVLAGTLALGHFVGVDLALAQERDVLRALGERGELAASIERPRSIVRRLVGFSLGGIAFAVTAVGFVLFRDFEILAASTDADLGAAARHAMVELAVTGAVLLAIVVHLVLSFARNLRAFFDNETAVLEQVRLGQLDRAVPVASDDEFGVIAEHTNRMIEGLREQRRVRDVLGKIVSPAVARELLDGQGPSLGGSRRTVTLLFSDVRDFTAWSEGAEPEELVRDLNAYFTEMVEVVHREGGVVDKFIGDGMMAVFGLSTDEGASVAATRAAAGMVAALEELNPRLSRPIGVGIGLHRGEVVAGNIGSPDRLEFTFIGDAVNTAARIEALTRSVDATVLISRAVLEDLDPEARGSWVSRGEHPLKGKAEPVEVLAPAA